MLVAYSKYCLLYIYILVDNERLSTSPIITLTRKQLKKKIPLLLFLPVAQQFYKAVYHLAKFFKHVHSAPNILYTATKAIIASMKSTQ